MTYEEALKEIDDECRSCCGDGCKDCRTHYVKKALEKQIKKKPTHTYIGKPEQPMSKEELIAALKKYCDSFGMTCDGCAIGNANCGCMFERKSYADLKRLYDIAYPKEINFVKIERNEACMEAANAIEKLETELNVIRKELNAAVKDLHGYCWCCTKVKQSCFPTDDEDCKNWEWRGVQE